LIGKMQPFGKIGCHESLTGRGIVELGRVCDIFYWRDVTICFTMTYIAVVFSSFGLLLER